MLNRVATSHLRMPFPNVVGFSVVITLVSIGIYELKYVLPKYNVENL